MYCKNCGNAMDDKDNVCINCGTPAGQGNLYCRNCGTLINSGAVICVACGCAVNNKTVVTAGTKSKMAAGLLGIFLGAFGVHNFYLGYTTKAVIQLLMTLLSCGILGFASEIWGLVEGILILTGNINTDAEGNPLGE
ncbi:MAG: NINE protein [Ruminococcus sp.]|nr:NINE protein [Ruminococcus sp.]